MQARQVCVTLVVVIVVVAVSVGIYFIVKSDSSSSSDDWLDDVSLDEALATYDEEANTFKSYNTCGERSYVALSFDDGPNAITTPTILAHLADANIKATFFVTPAVSGEASSEQCNLIPTILEQGHALHSHSWNHPNFMDITTDEAALQLYKVKQWVTDCAGDQADKVSIQQFRPPFGDLSGDMATFVTALGYTIAGWNIDSLDAGVLTAGGEQSESAEEAFNVIQQSFETDIGSGNSAIILMHDGQYSADGVEGLIPLLATYFTNLGYTFVTGDECHSGCQEFGVGICENTDTWPRFHEL